MDPEDLREVNGLKARPPFISRRASICPIAERWLNFARDLEKPFARFRMERFKGVAHKIAPDDAPGSHHGLDSAQTALPVLIINERQDPRVNICCLRAPTGTVMLQNQSN
jgi:hypothetical protein